MRIEADDRAGIERLVRYCARLPFALERLHALDSSTTLASPESRLIYRFPKPDLHGRTELLLTSLELLEALAKFVPPPRVHRHRYHGVLAPNARLRPHVVALGLARPLRQEGSSAPPALVDWTARTVRDPWTTLVGTSSQAGTRSIDPSKRCTSAGPPTPRVS